mgnify:CR=1 FL=1
MIDSKKKILVLCPYPEGVAAGQRLKYEQYIENWQENGFEVEVSNFSDIDLWSILHQEGHYARKFLGTIRGYLKRIKILFKIKDYDLVYVFMWVSPIGTLFERAVRGLSKSLIFDFDDFVHIDLSFNETSFTSWIIAKLKGGSRKTKYLIKNSDHVIISSPFHLDYCRNLNYKHASDYIPCSLNTDYFVPRHSSKKQRKVVIGWTGTFSSKPYLDSLKEVFMSLSEMHDFKLKIIGNFDYKLPGIDLEVIQWSKDHEIDDLQSIDIGIYPIFFDEWGLGKGGLKAMQYMAIGLPVVASDYGTSSIILENQKDGLLVKTNEDWLNALNFLIKNPDKRSELGQYGRKKVVEKYSTNVVKSKYLAILESNCL